MKLERLSNPFLILLLCLVSFGIYANSLNGDFLIDDYNGILNNDHIKDARVFFSKYFKLQPGSLYELTKLFNWHISGQNPFFYHLFNILLHICCVILLFILCNELFKNRMLSFLSSLIFAIHPIHTEAVSWISGGNYIFSSIFFIASLFFYIRSDRSKFQLLLSIIAFGLCLLSGAPVAILPIVFILYDLFFRDKTNQSKNKIRFQILILSLISVISVIFVASMFMSRNQYIHLIFQFRSYGYLIVALKAFVYYLKILYLPLARGLYHPFAFDTFNIQNLSPALFISILILTIAIISFFKCRRSLKPVSFGIMLFFVTYAPYSNIIPICNIISERYLYLPSAGFSIMIAALFLKIWELINKNNRFKALLRYVGISAITLFLGSYMALTLRRNYDYNNILTYWWSNINNFPDGYIVYNNLAGTFYAMGDLNNAMAYCYTNLMVDKNQPHVWCNLGKIYRDMRDFKEAGICYQNALEIDNNYFPAQKALKEIEDEVNSR